MKHALEYLGTFFHLIGMLLFVGGHLWFGLLTAVTERRQDWEGARFLAQQVPLMANIFGLGVLLLFSSGVLRLLVWGEPGLIFLPDPYGWLLLSKLVLYMIIVVNGMVIERRYLPYVVREVSQGIDMPRAWRVTPAWSQLKTRARFNLLLILLAVALGEAMRYSKL